MKHCDCSSSAFVVLLFSPTPSSTSSTSDLSALNVPPKSTTMFSALKLPPLTHPTVHYHHPSETLSQLYLLPFLTRLWHSRQGTCKTCGRGTATLCRFLWTRLLGVLMLSHICRRKEAKSRCQYCLWSDNKSSSPSHKVKPPVPLRFVN